MAPAGTPRRISSRRLFHRHPAAYEQVVEMETKDRAINIEDPAVRTNVAETRANS
jgi:hypothetical protein